MQSTSISVSGKIKKDLALSEISSTNQFSIREFVNILMDLTKFRITFFVAITTTVGFLLHAKSFDPNLFFSAIGVLILASGASALNEYQERFSDGLMDRTKNRPIPSGKLTGNIALFISVTLLVVGALALYGINLSVMLLGMLTLVWYNFIYTPLKRITTFAIIPGALVGALPPMIGFAASGGNIFDPVILSLATFMFIWQIPHFWILMLIYDEQYQKAGYPTLSEKFSTNQSIRITQFWIGLFVISSLLFFVTDVVSTTISVLSISILGIYVFTKSVRTLNKSKSAKDFKKSFMLINLYVLVVLVIISIENIL